MAAALHPPDDTLVAFGLGRLDDPVADDIARHLEACPACQRRGGDLPARDLPGRPRGAPGAQADTPPPGEAGPGAPARGPPPPPPPPLAAAPPYARPPPP